jgi:hypothetical protein
MAIIKLRKVFMKGNAGKAKVRINGNYINIDIRPLSASCEKAVLSALLYIKLHYQSEVLGVPLDVVLGLARFVIFVQTDSPEVGAYASCKMESPVIIIDRWLMKSKPPKMIGELAVTILHELIHFTHDEIVDKRGDSEFEAKFDLLCYAALNLPISSSHWAWKRLGIDTEPFKEIIIPHDARVRPSHPEDKAGLET